MTEGQRHIDADRHDPDDAPEPTEEMPDIAEPAIGGKGVRPPTGDLGPNGAVRGRRRRWGGPGAR